MSYLISFRNTVSCSYMNFKGQKLSKTVIFPVFLSPSSRCLRCGVL